MEIARNVLGVRDADHEETLPGGSRLVITALSCSLVGQSHPVHIAPGTAAGALYGVNSAIEDYYCNYGVNPEYIPGLLTAGLRISGTSEDGAVRLVELTAHPFFMGALFLPQSRSTRAAPHPVLRGFATAVSTYMMSA